MSWGELTCGHLDNVIGRPCTPKWQTCNKQCQHYKLKHYTNGEDCWCEPEKITMNNGNKVILHREEQ